MNMKWDAKRYTDNFQIITKYGEDMLSLIDVKNSDMSCVDLGCGNGKLTQKLVDLGLNTIGIDESDDQVREARRLHPHLKFRQDNAITFKVEPVDVIFSSAVFHWISQEYQQEMIQNIYNNLKDEGQFILELGGADNTRQIQQAIDESFTKYNLEYISPFYFPTVAEYTTILENAGFKIQYLVNFKRPTQLKGENGMKQWLEMFLGIPFRNISQETRDKIITNTTQILKPIQFKDGDWYADYERLRIKAIKNIE